MNDPFNNDSLDSGTSHDYTGGQPSDLGYNQHDNLNVVGGAAYMLLVYYGGVD